MVKIPFTWPMQNIAGIQQSNNFRCMTIYEFKLDEKWKMVYFGLINRDITVPKSLSICRTWSPEGPEVLIFGTLSFRTNKTKQQIGLKRNFTKFLMSKESTHAVSLEHMLPENHDKGFSLAGVINFLSVAEITTELENKDYNKCVGLESLSSDLECLLLPQTSNFFDINLKCADGLVSAHKNILSARSPVFSAMFKCQMKECVENEVRITDMDISGVQLMLAYLYTGKIPILNDETASKLLFAADKYQLHDLKKACCCFLKDNLCPSNLYRILVLGYLHDEVLKSYAVKYICDYFTNFSVLEKEDDWQSLRKERPNLALDIATSMLKLREENPPKKFKRSI